MTSPQIQIFCTEMGVQGHAILAHLSQFSISEKHFIGKKRCLSLPK